jgi:hypothetical protein
MNDDRNPMTGVILGVLVGLLLWLLLLSTCSAAVPEWCRYVMSPAGEDGPCVEKLSSGDDDEQPAPCETGSESPADGREQASQQDRRRPVYTTLREAS